VYPPGLGARGDQELCPAQAEMIRSHFRQLGAGRDDDVPGHSDGRIGHGSQMVVSGIVNCWRRLLVLDDSIRSRLCISRARLEDRRIGGCAWLSGRGSMAPVLPTLARACCICTALFFDIMTELALAALDKDQFRQVFRQIDTARVT